MDHIDRKEPALCIFSGKDDPVTEWILGSVAMQRSGTSGMRYFVNILINILTPVLQSLYGPNHQGHHMQHTDERERENKSPQSLL